MLSIKLTSHDGQVDYIGLPQYHYDLVKDIFANEFMSVETRVVPKGTVLTSAKQCEAIHSR